MSIVLSSWTALRIALAAAAAGAPFRTLDDGKTKPAPAAQPAAWTLLIYGAADNNADGHMFDCVNGIREAVADHPGIRMVLFMDRSTGFSTDRTSLGEDFTGARLYELGAKSATRLAGGEHFPEMKLDAEHETDSSDPENLRKFLAFGKANYPAKRTALIIYSHADGITMCPDEQASHSMGIAELTDVVTEEESVDFMGLELCNMGGIEIAYQWRPGNGGFSTDVLLAIPNAGPPLDWKRIFGRVHDLDLEKLTAVEFGRIAIEEGEKGRIEAAKANPQQAERASGESGAAYDLQAVEDVKVAMDAFAVALAQAEARELLEKLRDGDGNLGVEGDSKGPGPVMNYSGDQFREAHAFVDLYALLRRAVECNELDEDSRAAARKAMEAIDTLVIASFGMSGYRGFEAGKTGVFTSFPDGDAKAGGLRLGRSTLRVWDDFDWYVPFEVKQKDANLGNLAWCRDGATPGDRVVDNWFELLDSWFDVDDENGGVNRYRW